MRFERVEEGDVAKTFGRDIHEMIFILRKILQAKILLGCWKRAVDESGGNIAACEAIHLVFHQRDERRDDERETFELQCRKLKDERLARACRHDNEGVMIVEETLNRLLLSRAEGGEAEVGLEGGGNVHESECPFLLRQTLIA